MEEPGVKRSIGEREDFAERSKTRAEEKAEVSRKPGEGVDINHFDVVREIGAACVCESDAKFDEELLGFINRS